MTNIYILNVLFYYSDIIFYYKVVIFVIQLLYSYIRQNKKISVHSGNRFGHFRQGRLIYVFKYFFWNKYNFMHFERHSAYKMPKKIFF